MYSSVNMSATELTHHPVCIYACEKQACSQNHMSALKFLQPAAYSHVPWDGTDGRLSVVYPSCFFGSPSSSFPTCNSTCTNAHFNLDPTLTIRLKNKDFSFGESRAIPFLLPPPPSIHHAISSSTDVSCSMACRI